MHPAFLREDRCRPQAIFARMSMPIDLTILMPCLNEAETLGACIAKAKLGLERAGVLPDHRRLQAMVLRVGDEPDLLGEPAHPLAVAD